jgi:group I intron endonuclease
MQGIYCIENSVSGRKYYGSSDNIKKRLAEHQRDLQKRQHHNIQLQRSFDKHGEHQFTFSLVEETYFNSVDELRAYEQIFLDRNIGGYNMAPAKGGDTLSNHPNKEEIRERINKSHEETMILMTKEEKKERWGHTGASNFNFRNGGKSFKICPACNINKISFKARTCADCRDRTGKNNPFYGKTHTEEVKENLRKLNSGENSWIKGIDPAILSYTKTYQIIYTDGTIRQTAGLRDIAKEFDVSIENVYATIKRINEGKIPKRGRFAGIIIKEITV